MAITRAQQARQLYKNGKRVGLKGGGQDMGGGSSGVGGQSPGPGGGEGKGGRGGSNTGGGKGGEKGDADSNNPRRGGAGPYKDPQKPKRKPKKTKKNTAPKSFLKNLIKNNIYAKGLQTATDVLSNNALAYGLNAKQREYSLEELKETDPASYNEVMKDLTTMGYVTSGVGPLDIRRDIKPTFTDLGEPQAKEILGKDYQSYLGEITNRFTPIDGPGSNSADANIYIPPVIEEEEEKEEDVPISYRFMADGGRAAFQQGGGIFPRIDKLGNKVSSAEQELAAISQRLDTAQSSLGGQGGQNSGGGIMNNSILPDSPFPNVAEPAEVSPFPGIEPVSNEGVDGQTDSSYNQNFNNIFTAPSPGGEGILEPNIGSNNPAGPRPIGGRVPGGGSTPPQTLPDGTPYDPGRPIPGRQPGAPTGGGDPFDPRFADDFGETIDGINQGDIRQPGAPTGGGDPFDPRFADNFGELQPLPGFDNRRPMPFELQGPGTGNAPPMAQLGQYTLPTPGKLSPIPEGVGPRIPRLPPGLSGAINQGSGMNLGVGGGQLLNAGPRIPQPTITPGPNLQNTPLQTAISGGGLANLGYGKPANMMSPAVGDPRTGAQQIDGNLAQMMMRGGFAEGGMPEYEGGIMDLESGRQQYFLGKLVKKATRAVKKVAKSPFGKALILGGLTFGIPGVNQGFFSKGLMGTKSGLGFKKFLGDKILGEATIKSGGVQRSGGLLNFIKNNKALSGIVGGSLLAGITAPKSTYDAEQEDDFVLDIPEQYRFYADGGRIGYASGSGEDFSKSKVYQKWVQRYESNPDSPLVTMHEKADAFKNFYERSKNAQAEGSKEPVAKETMPLLDMNNQEMDLRQEGGFVPIGRMEKADDVPARLSKNEFVFTADAVRNAGEGDIDKGAEVMYNMMKNLESGGEVSEESQGLDGAREMFQTSQRLEEVL